MDTLEHQPSPNAPEPSRDDLQAQVASLTSLLNSVLILVFVLAGSVDYYFFRQASITRDELVATRQYGMQIARNLQAVEELARKLADYGKTHPDFAPIVHKYGLNQVPAASTPVSGMPAPAPAVKPKK